MRRTSASLIALTLLASAADAARSAERGLTVITSGSEQALQLGETVLSRPFGAQLVDSMAIVGRYGARAERLWIVQGTAGATCPARYVVVSAKSGQPPIVSAPFGTCGTGVRAQPSGGGLLLSVAPLAPGAAPSRYMFRNGGVTPLDGTATVAVTQAAQQTVRCRNPGDMAALDGTAFEYELDRALPAAYRTSGSVRRAEIAPTALHEMVAGLACLASWPGGGRPVTRAATPLFASKRYGAASFAALDRIAGATNSEPGLRASARYLYGEMRYRVGAREPL